MLRPSRLAENRALRASLAPRVAPATVRTTKLPTPLPLRAAATRSTRPAYHLCASSLATRRPLSTTSSVLRHDDGSTPAASEPNPTTPPAFQPRRRFPLPTAIPSWYAGHMQRAIRSMPYLLSRHPPPLVIEARDSRLPITSINPIFEELLRKAPAANAGFSDASDDGDDIGHGWGSRRLIVYTKRDLIDPRLQEPIRRAFKKHGEGQDVLFVDTRKDRDVIKVLEWVQKRARHLVASPLSAPVPRSERAEKRAKSTLSGAFRHTSTPEEGVRLLILGMPNVGKSSLLNALRRVGTGKGKAASTAPHPGHTRKLTGTVRISKHGPSQHNDRSDQFGGGRTRSASRGRSSGAEADAAEGEGEGEGSLFTLDSDDGTSSQLDAAPTSDNGGDGTPEAAAPADGGASKKSYDPPIYVYDTPGVMVPFLGRGRAGAERAIKLAVAAGIKTSLFDVQMLADYLLFRMNLCHGYALEQRPPSSSSKGQSPLQPAYLTHMPLPLNRAKPTNSVTEFLELVAERAPGTLNRGGERDLDGAAEFFVQRWREGKVGDRLGELDFGIKELDPIYADEDEVGTEMVSNSAPSDHVEATTPHQQHEECIEDRIDRLIASHFLEVERDMLQRDRGRGGEEGLHGHSITSSRVSREGVPLRRESSAVRSRNKALESGSSTHQAKKQIKREGNKVRVKRLKEKGVTLKKKGSAMSLAARAPWITRLQRNGGGGAKKGSKGGKGGKK